MPCAIELLVVLALISTGIAIMIGVLTPGDALRRLAAVIVFLLVVPMVITRLMQEVIAPALVSLRTVAKEIGVALAGCVALSMIGWVILHHMQRQSGTNNRRNRGE